ncbi:(2R)-sulfolactate sulfo-lyase subunit alpha [Desulfotomaculum arcticum]|uniref:(2R)-sulfolactate sulfo-lyase subunit alpha n=1 Tax=Desulfotruncus arcticus DSM 17038 TaxID=1121424 RepID=A0A1I2YQH8_9FIRM|nr:UxaA family hydrolase [Desulfotruncus arcticus]SFH27326.1 (2R)-sulfolactate sulfo-lyase subunit alpha [Desulfotomaculum arcticum] [Desulfotruncus arcticus DSM 17038]
MNQPYFIIHDENDTVGVAVKEIKAGETLEGWVMSSDTTVSITAKNDIKIGHKIAMKDIEEGMSIIKYNRPIGKVSAPIKKGEHVHTHNLKTARW